MRQQEKRSDMEEHLARNREARDFAGDGRKNKSDKETQLVGSFFNWPYRTGPQDGEQHWPDSLWITLRILVVEPLELDVGQWVPSLCRQGPPTRRFGRIGRLGGGASKADDTHLIGGLAITGQCSQSQQTNALFPGAEALAAKRQDMAIKALSTDVAQVRHAGKLTFEPGPPAWLPNEP